MPTHSPIAVLALYRDADPNWPLYAAQGWVESRFNPRAVSPAGARGVAQFMPATWEWAQVMGWAPRGASPDDPHAAIPAQVAFMAWLLNKYHGSRRQALAAYNWGPGNVTRTIREHGPAWESHLPRETFAYIRQVLAVDSALRTFLN